MLTSVIDARTGSTVDFAASSLTIRENSSSVNVVILNSPLTVNRHYNVTLNATNAAGTNASIITISKLYTFTPLEDDYIHHMHVYKTWCDRSTHRGGGCTWPARQ